MPNIPANTPATELAEAISINVIKLGSNRITPMCRVSQLARRTFL